MSKCQQKCANNLFTINLFFLQTFRTLVLLVEPMTSLFWTWGEICPRFQTLGGSPSLMDFHWQNARSMLWAFPESLELSCHNCSWAVYHTLYSRSSLANENKSYINVWRFMKPLTNPITTHNGNTKFHSKFQEIYHERSKSTTHRNAM